MARGQFSALGIAIHLLLPPVPASGAGGFYTRLAMILPILGAVLFSSLHVPQDPPLIGKIEYIGFGCGGKAGIPPDLVAETSPYLGQEFQFSVFTNAQIGGTPGLLSLIWGYETDFWSTLKLPLELGFAGMPGCFLFIGPGGHMGSRRTAATFLWGIPEDLSLLGLEVYFQAAAHRNSNEWVTTRAMKVTIGWDPAEWILNPDGTWTRIMPVKSG